MNEERVILSSINNNLFFLPARKNRKFYYLIGFIVRIIFAGIYNDRRDGGVFFETGEDIIVRHTNIYNETTLHARFNYFPLAYLAILPGLLIYFILPFRNNILQRILQKLPLILLELLTAYHIREKKDVIEKISSYELLILFNPILIFGSCVKGQFDIFPAFLLLLAWNSYKNDKQIRSGFYSGAAFLFKQYGIIFIFFITISLMKSDFVKMRKYIVGNLLIGFPILIIASILNFHGLIDHSIIFHLKRKPNGYSLTAWIFLGSHKITESLWDEKFANIVSSVFQISLTIVLIVLLIMLAVRLWNSENSKREVLETLMLGYLVFFILNNAFFYNYLAILLILWVEYKREKAQSLTNSQLAWNYAYLPIIGIFKKKIPLDIRELFGSNWLVIIYFTCLLLHLIIMFLIQKKEIPLYKNKFAFYSYILFVLIIPFNFIGTFYDI